MGKPEGAQGRQWDTMGDETLGKGGHTIQHQGKHLNVSLQNRKPDGRCYAHITYIVLLQNPLAQLSMVRIL